MTDPKMISLWYEVNMNMSLSNDLLSLRKEIVRPHQIKIPEHYYLLLTHVLHTEAR